jgi:type IV pilus assembly protein PilM
LLKAINECMPSDPPRKPDERLPSDAERITSSNELHVTALECQWLEDVSKWYAAVKQDEEKTLDAAGKAAGGAAASGPAPVPAPDASAAQSPTGPGWIIQIRGHHFHNADRIDTVRGAEYVRTTLIAKLRAGKVKLASGSRGGAEEVSMRELGIRCPVLVKPLKPVPVDLPIPTAQAGSSSHPTAAPEAKPGPGGATEATHVVHAAGDDAPRTVGVQKFDFDVQFCWQPKTPTERHEAKKTQDQAARPVAQQ